MSDPTEGARPWAIGFLAVVIAVLGRPALAQDKSSAWTVADQSDLAQRLEAAPQLDAQELCTPGRGSSGGMIHFVPNPDGKTWDYIKWYWKTYGQGVHAFAADLGTGEVHRLDYPTGRKSVLSPSWEADTIGPDRKLYFAGPARIDDNLCGMEVYTYDPAANRLSWSGVIAPDLKGELRPICVATDGQMFGAGNNYEKKRPGLFQIDPGSGKITDLGLIGPDWTPENVWAQSIAADDHFVYLACGKTPWRLLAYDRQTGSTEVLLTTERISPNLAIKVVQERCGVSGFAEKVVGTDGQRTDYWFYQGRAIPKREAKEAPPWPAPPVARPWFVAPPKPEVSVEPGAGDEPDKLWWRDHPEKGQTPGPWRSALLPKDTWPLTINHVMTLSDGRILGYLSPYGGNFVFDPKSGKSRFLGPLPELSNYTMAEHEGRVYMSGYPSGTLWIYDLAKPWTAWRAEASAAQSAPAAPPRMIEGYDEGANPWHAGYLRALAGTHKIFDSAVGADGRIYFGGTWVRDASCGGLAWFDPKATDGDKKRFLELSARSLKHAVTAAELARQKAVGGFWEDFSNYTIHRLAAVDGGRLIAISTEPVADAKLGKPKPAQGAVFFYDVAKGQLVGRVEPVEGTQDCGALVGLPGGRVLGICADPKAKEHSILYGIDARDMKLAFTRNLPGRQNGNFLLAGDGSGGSHAWTFLGDVLVRIDPATAAVEPVGRTDARGAFAISGRDYYVGRGSTLVKISNVVPAGQAVAPVN